MLIRLLPLASLMFIGLVQGAPAPAEVSASTKLERKLVGRWVGAGCDGTLVLRPDGTYDLTQYGPGGDDSKGTWRLRWDKLPPTLVLTCKESDFKEEIGTELLLEVLKLNDKHLQVGYGDDRLGPSGAYERSRK